MKILTRTPIPSLRRSKSDRLLAGVLVSIDRAAIAKIELGQRRVCDFELIALADVLRVDVKWLLGIE
jgi:hypothetical protein